MGGESLPECLRGSGTEGGAISLKSIRVPPRRWDIVGEVVAGELRVLVALCGLEIVSGLTKEFGDKSLAFLCAIVGREGVEKDDEDEEADMGIEVESDNSSWAIGTDILFARTSRGIAVALDEGRGRAGDLLRSNRPEAY